MEGIGYSWSLVRRVDMEVLLLEGCVHVQFLVHRMDMEDVLEGSVASLCLDGCKGRSFQESSVRILNGVLF